MILGIILTGLILYTHTYHEGLGGLLYHILRPLEAAMGGLADVRTYHRILMWVIMIFVPVHIYMAIFNAVKGKDGAMDAIISGCSNPRSIFFALVVCVRSCLFDV